MRTITFDTETNGLINDKIPLDHESQPYPVQLAFITTGLDFGITEEFCKIIRPPDGVIIPPEVERIHGISTERAFDEGIPLLDALNVFAEATERLSREAAQDPPTPSGQVPALRCAYNLVFDDKVMVAACLRQTKSIRTVEAARSLLYDGTVPMCVMDTATGFMRTPGEHAGFRKLKLAQVYRRLMGEKMPDAHDALGDVKGTLTVFKKMVELVNK